MANTMNDDLTEVVTNHKLRSAHRCSCGWEGDSATTHIIDALGLERVGWYDDQYGPDNDVPLEDQMCLGDDLPPYGMWEPIFRVKGR